VRLTRTDLPQQNLNATYSRMQAERQRDATDEIARGNEAAQTLRAEADRAAVEITSEASKQAEIIRGQADAKRSAIYSEAYGQDPEFYAFTRSLSAYGTALKSGTTAFVMAPEGEFFHYFGADPKGQSGAESSAATGTGSTVAGGSAPKAP
jgi:membrane protease subunit HflC